MADDFLAKDATGTNITFRAKDIGGKLHPYRILMDSSGNDLIGQKLMTGSLPFVPASNWPLLGSGVIIASANFTRLATTPTYASGQLVANDTNVANVVPLTFSVARVAAFAFKITRCRLFKSSISLTNAQFRLHLYSAAPTIVNGDTGAWSTTGANYLGALAITIDRAFTDGAYGDGVALNTTNNEAIRHKLASGSAIKGLIEARAAYVGVSAEVFTATLEVEQT